MVAVVAVVFLFVCGDIAAESEDSSNNITANCLVQKKCSSLLALSLSLTAASARVVVGAGIEILICVKWALVR